MFFAFLLFIIFFGYLNSIFAIYMEVFTYNQYRRRKEIFKLILAALSEPFFFHPFVVWAGIRGYFRLFQETESLGRNDAPGLSKPKAQA